MGRALARAMRVPDMTPLERAAYLAHAASASHRRKVADAIAMIAGAPGAVVSTSWGKDSVALLHLAAVARPTIAVINARYPNPAERFDDMDRVRDLALAMPDMASVRYAEVDTPGEWEMYERSGGGFAEAVTPKQREAARWWKQNFTRAMDAAMRAAGGDAVALGLRAEESHARRMNVAMHGRDYTRRDGLRVLLPLANWSGRDVWAYLVSRGLPWLRIYDEATCPREVARSGFVFATGGGGAIRRHGVWDDWRRVYRPEFQAWLVRFPELDR